MRYDRRAALPGSATGLQILRNGGNAADAAVAANAVLCVAYPHMAGLGGDGFWLVHAPGTPGVQALNASGPGAVDGWRQMHERWGKLAWGELFADAVRYAREGVPVSRSPGNWITQDISILRENPSAARTYFSNGERRREGERLIQPGLARSLEAIAVQGARKGFYEGEIAKEICRALGPEGSPLRPRDFAEFRAEWVEPISTTYCGFIAYECPPNTQGFAALEILNLIKGLDVAAWGDGTADYYHHMAEAVKLAFADRDAWLTNPHFVEIPLERSLSKEYAAVRRELIESYRAMEVEEVEPGIPFDPGAFRAGGGWRGRQPGRRKGKGGGAIPATSARWTRRAWRYR